MIVDVRSVFERNPGAPATAAVTNRANREGKQAWTANYLGTGWGSGAVSLDLLGGQHMSEELAGVTLALHQWVEDSDIDPDAAQRRAAHLSARACLDAGASFETALTAGALILRLLAGSRHTAIRI